MAASRWLPNLSYNLCYWPIPDGRALALAQLNRIRTSIWGPMRNTRLVLAVILLQGIGLDVSALEIEVGHRPINLPLPDGFVELTPAMSPYYEAMRAYIGPNNLRYATLITTNDAEALLRGEDIEIQRYINVESEKGISAISVSSAQFADFRSILRDQIDDMYANAEEQLPELISKGNHELSEEFDADLAVEFGGLVPLPIHLDTDNAMANSMFMTVGGTVDGENIGAEVVAATTLFLHVKDKVLFLYVYGQESEIEWTRETAERWATDIVAANPLSAAEQRAVERSDSIGIDWSQVLEKTLIGAFVGGAIGLFSFLFRKRQKK